MSSIRNIKLLQARLIDPLHKTDQVCDIYFSNSRLIAHGSPPDNFKDAEQIDGSNLLVCPRFIDSTFHLCDPGYEQKGTIESETFAARQSGFGSLITLPNTSPVVDTPAIAKLIRDKAHQCGHVDIHPLGAITESMAGTQLTEMAALKDAGCIGVSNYRSPFANTKVALQALKYAHTFELPVFFYAHVASLYNKGHINEGSTAIRLGLNGIPVIAETLDLTKNLMLVEETGVHAHFGQITCGESVEIIAKAQQKGLPVTASASIFHLLFDDTLIEDYNANYHVIPPLRSMHDIEMLREGIKSGVISAISSDHFPHEIAAKMAPFPNTEPGISTIDSFVPLCLQLVEKGVISLYEMVQLLTSNPAENFSFPTGGAITPESFTIIDLLHEWELNDNSMFSHGKNNPLKGQSLKGKYIQL